MSAAGRDFTRIDVDSILPSGKRVKAYRINGTRPDTLGRFFLFVDQAAYDALPTQQEARARHFINNQTVLKSLEQNGYCYQVVADLPGGRVYRFAAPTFRRASAFSTPAPQATGGP